MTVKEIKALCPLADVYELKKDARYVVVIPASEKLERLAEGLRPLGLKGVIITCYYPDDLKFIELGDAEK